MHVFRERASAITQTKYCPKQDPRQSVTSSYHLNQSALRGSDSSTREKKGYSFVNAHRLHKISRRICQLVAVLYRTAATSQIRELESLCIRQRAIMNWPSGNRSFALTAPTSTPKGLFKICSVHFASDCFERTVHIEGAPRRLIAGSIPTTWKPSVEGTTSAISARSRREVSK